MTSITPSVTFFISDRISSRFLVLGIPPTNRRQLSTLAHTPRRRPVLKDKRISLSVQKCFLHCVGMSWRSIGSELSKLTWSHSCWAASWLFWLPVWCRRWQRHSRGCSHWSPSSFSPRRSYQTRKRRRRVQKNKRCKLIGLEWYNKLLTFSHSGTNSSSNRSRGSFPTKISLPLSGGGPSQSGGGPPYRRWPFSWESWSDYSTVFSHLSHHQIKVWTSKTNKPK